MNASYNKIADKAHVSFARVKRWLPVYQRTGCVFDDTKPGPVPTPWHITEPRPPRLIPNSHYKRQERLKGKWIPHPVSKVGSDKHHRIHARERMVQVYEKRIRPPVTTLLLRRLASKHWRCAPLVAGLPENWKGLLREERWSSLPLDLLPQQLLNKCAARYNRRRHMHE